MLLPNGKWLYYLNNMYCGLNNIPTQIALQSSITEMDSDITSINSRLNSISSVANSKTEIISGSYTGNNAESRTISVRSGDILIIFDDDDAVGIEILYNGMKTNTANNSTMLYSGSSLYLTKTFWNTNGDIYRWYVFS